MANVKNFGLVGVGAELQFSKAGSRLKTAGGNFTFRNAADDAEVSATASALTATTGNLTATLGNLELSAVGATITIGTDATMSREAAGVLKFNGSAAFVAPTGNDAARPAGVTGMVRVNTQVGANDGRLEFYDGDAWQQSLVASGAVAMTGNLDMSTNRVTNVGEPIGDQDAATKYYVDNAIEGLHWKQAVNVLSSTNVPLTGAFPLVIDGYTMTAADAGYRILLIGQTTGSQDGIYVLNDAGGGNYSLTRSADANTPDELNGAAVFVLEGSSYEGTAWVQVNHYLVSSFAGQDWVQFAGGGAYTAGDGITISGTVISAHVDDVTIFTNETGALAVKSSATPYQVLLSNGIGSPTTEAVWGALPLNEAAAVTGILPIEHGGTGASSFTATRVIFAGSGSPSATTLTDDADFTFNTTGNVLSVGSVQLQGTNDRVITTNVQSNTVLTLFHTPGESVAISDGASGSTLEFVNDVVVWGNGNNERLRINSSGAWSFGSGGSPSDFGVAGQFLKSNGAGAAPTWSDASGLDAAGNNTEVQFNDGGVFGASSSFTFDKTTTVMTVGDLSFNGNGLGIPTISSTVDLTINTGVMGGLTLTGGQGVSATATEGDASLTSTIGNVNITASGTSPGGDVVVSAGRDFTTTAADNITLAATTSDVTITAGDAVNITAAGNMDLAADNVAFTLPAGSPSGTVTIEGPTAQQYANSMANNSLVNKYYVDQQVTAGTNVGASNIAYGGGDGTITGESAFQYNDTTNTMTIGGMAINGTTNTITDLAGGSPANGLTLTTNNGKNINLLPDTGGSVVIGQVGDGIIESQTGYDLKLTGNVDLDLTSTTGNVNITAAGGSPAGDVVVSAGDDFTATAADNITLTATAGDVTVAAGDDVVVTAAGDVGITATGVMTLTSGGDLTVALPAGSPASTVTVTGPTAQQYANAVADADLVNKLYVDQAISAGAAAGAIKAFQATVNLGSNTTTNIGTPLPAGATILRVKVNVTSAASAVATLVVGKSGGSEYMTSTENDIQTTGLYLAECFVTEAGSVQLTALVAAATGGGSAVVIVEYQVQQ